MSICGGGHLARVWSQKEIDEHIKEPCIDCYCGIPFKEENE